MSLLSCSLGVRQTRLDDDFRAFVREASPWSFILFREACASRAQVRALCQDLRDAAGRDAVIFIDQEGGRVARLKPPEWPVWPACAAYGELYRRDPGAGVEAAELGFRLIAAELKAMGVDGDFAPVLDIAVTGADAVVGDRAFSSDGGAIAALGRAALAGLHAGGVAGCLKHIPGHGRAAVDTHFALPRIAANEGELAADIAPFQSLRDAEAAITAHIVYEAWDREQPATCSKAVIEGVIRTRIGFDGLLLSDDLDMKALAVAGGLRERAERALGAGCDIVLQCSGALKDMEAAAQGCRSLGGAALARAEAVAAIAKRAPKPFDADAGWARFKTLLAAP